MTRADYYRLYSLLRMERRKVRDVSHYNDMADSQLVVQQTEHNDYVCMVRARIDSIEKSMPPCKDPMGFGMMHYRWCVAKAEAMRKRHWRTQQTDHFYAMKRASRQARSGSQRIYV